MFIPGQSEKREVCKQMQQTYTTHTFMPMVVDWMLIVAPTWSSLSSARIHTLLT
ncbi:MAG: hypothetical protein NVS3B14_12970 [Ktedonobacteraceae bacterium]